jgi:hypothetical protein
MREERTIIVCESCRTELAGWRIEVILPFFLLEQADDAHVWSFPEGSQDGGGRRGGIGGVERLA